LDDAILTLNCTLLVSVCKGIPARNSVWKHRHVYTE
jgi:hypothetical protein